MKNEPINNPFTWLVGFVAALTIAAAGIHLDGPDEIQAAHDVADYAAAVSDAGVSMCKEFGRVPVWTRAGDLVCRVAVSPPVVAQGGAQ